MTREKYGFCDRCKAAVLWLMNNNTKKMAPIDREPSEDGNCLVGVTMYQVLTKDALLAHRADGIPLHKSHFVTCPHADKFRRSK